MQSLEKEFWIWVLSGSILLIGSSLIDTQIFVFLEQYIRSPFLNTLSIFLTEQFIYGIFSLFLLGTVWRVWHNQNHRSKLLPAAFAFVVTGIISIILKQLIAVPRPFLYFEHLYPLVSASFHSFPSSHTALSFALLVPFFRISKFLGFSWGIIALFVGVARIYQNVHFPSDIAGGIFLGGVIGSLFSNPNAELLLKKWWANLEFRRQSFHFVAGFLCVFFHWAGFFRWRVILLCLILGLILSALSVNRKLPFVSEILRLFDRKRDQKFPGRGAFYFLLGIFLSIVLFPVKIAYASILILSIGDSVNHLFFERNRKGTKLPWNRRKTLLGLGLGIFSGTFAAHFFVALWPALLATTLALVLETIPFKLGRIFIDDNLSVPLVSGAILLALS